MNKMGIRKLEDKLEAKNELLINAVEVIQFMMVEGGMDTGRADDILIELKQHVEEQKQNNSESRNARKKYHHDYYEKNK